MTYGEDFRAVLILLSVSGLIVTKMEWDMIWSQGFGRGLARLFMLNLPIILAINLKLLGEI